MSLQNSKAETERTTKRKSTPERAINKDSEDLLGRMYKRDPIRVCRVWGLFKYPWTMHGNGVRVSTTKDDPIQAKFHDP